MNQKKDDIMKYMATCGGEKMEIVQHVSIKVPSVSL